MDNSRLRLILIGVLVLLVIVGVTVFTATKIRTAKVNKVAESEYGGTNYNQPDWQKMPDKTEELQSSLESAVKAKFPEATFKLTDVEGINATIYTITVDNVDAAEFKEAVQKIYIEYRDKGYKAMLTLKSDGQVVGYIPPRQKHPNE